MVLDDIARSQGGDTYEHHFICAYLGLQDQPHNAICLWVIAWTASCSVLAWLEIHHPSYYSAS